MAMLSDGAAVLQPPSSAGGALGRVMVPTSHVQGLIFGAERTRLQIHRHSPSAAPQVFFWLPSPREPETLQRCCPRSAARRRSLPRRAGRRVSSVSPHLPSPSSPRSGRRREASNGLSVREPRTPPVPAGAPRRVRSGRLPRRQGAGSLPMVGVLARRTMNYFVPIHRSLLFLRLIMRSPLGWRTRTRRRSRILLRSRRT